MLARLRNKADIERALAVPPCSRSAHFALHHVRQGEVLLETPPAEPLVQVLSTGLSTAAVALVDDSAATRLLGCMIPKRHARRAVTRNLLKRQARAAAQRHAHGLAPGLWLVRLRAPFARQRYVSAASPALRDAARHELERLFSQVCS